MRVVFFGSPEYALPSLRRLLEQPGVEVVAAVTQPARPLGRSGTPVPTPVARLAAEAGIEVLAPEKVDREVTTRVAELRPDVGALAASGHILPQHLLDAFPHGVLNVHASLLPRHRGASPVAAAILAGDAETGASIMLVVRELDAGPVLGTVATPIGPLDTTGTLTERIAELGAGLLVELLPRWVAGEIEAMPQNEAEATYAPRLLKSAGNLDWRWPAEELWRRVRAFDPWPRATTVYRGERLAILAAWPVTPAIEAEPGMVLPGDGTELTPLLPGRLARVVVGCGSGGLALLRVQRAGRRALDIEEYLNGDLEFIGARLGP
jgi:methionyl-tRNA formyltransferase